MIHTLMLLISNTILLITLLRTLSDHSTKMLKAHSIAISSSESNSNSFTYQVSQRRAMAYIEKRVSVQGHPFAVPYIRAWPSNISYPWFITIAIMSEKSKHTIKDISGKFSLKPFVIWFKLWFFMDFILNLKYCICRLLGLKEV